MIGGFSIIPDKFKDCKCWQERLLWIVIMTIGSVMFGLSWIDRKIHRY